MREALLVLLVIAVLFGLTAFRYRRQIWTVIQMWRMIKSARDGNPKVNNGKSDLPGRSNEVLVNCSKCGKWVSENDAIMLGNKIVYCSSSCLEGSAKTV